MSGIGYYVLENYPLLGWGIFLVLWIVLAGLVSLLLWRYSQSKDSLKVEKDIRRLEKRRDDLVSEVDNMKEKTKNSLKLDAQIELEEERLRQIIEEKEEVEQWRTDNPNAAEKMEEFNVAKSEFERIETKLKMVEDQLKGASAELEERRRQREEYEDLSEDLTSLENRQKHLEKRNNRLEEDISEKGKDREDLIDRIGKLNAKKEQLDKDLKEHDNLQGEVKQLREEAEVRKHELKRGQITKNILEMIRPLDVEVYDVKKKFSDENKMLDKVIKYMGDKGFKFSDTVVYDFYTSLKVSSFTSLTVLEGLTGSGKSSLPRLFSEAVCARFHLEPVQPNWLTPSDLYGFYNHLIGDFNPTDFFRFFLATKQLYKNDICIVMLDEMNLSNVEYYFSDMLSVLEIRDKNKRYINPFGALKPSVDEKEDFTRLLIPENLLFVGTVNRDETVREFSPKVLDRANVLTFDIIEDEKPRIFQEIRKNIKPQGRLSWEGLQSFIKDDIDKDVHKYRDALLELNTLLKGEMKFGHRTYKAILYFLANYPKTNDNELDEAFVRQVDNKVIKNRVVRIGLRKGEEEVKRVIQRLESHIEDSKIDENLQDELCYRLVERLEQS